jgi:osmoprotectant transport system substrate-binding protein
VHLTGEPEEGQTMTRSIMPVRLLAAVALAALLLAACANGDGDDAANGEAERGALTVGSVDFDENIIVAAMYATALEDAGYTVTRRFRLGTREVVLPAAENGEVDVFPEYIGSAAEFLEPGSASGDTTATLEAVRAALADRGLEVLDPADAENKNGLVVRPETAEEFNLSTTSDLAAVAGGLTLGGPPECPERPLCMIGFQAVYGIEFGDFQPLQPGTVTFTALRDGDIDVALLFTTDEAIAENDWVLLDDDRDLQPAENLAPVVRSESLNDEIRGLLDRISAALTTEQLTELNRRVRVGGEDPEDVAEAWLEEQGLR